jgi:hypothetical protein
MKNNSINLSDITRSIGTFFRRFHTLLFFLVVSGGLFVAILMLLGIIALSSSQATSSDQTVNGTFDEATIQRIDQDSAPPVTPTGRSSPFVE